MNAAVERPVAKRRGLKGWWLVLLGPLAVLGCNAVAVEVPVQMRLAQDSRNAPISIHAYHRWGVNPNEIVLDLWNVDRSAAMVDVTRTLVDSAYALRDRNYNRVWLAYRGGERLLLEGAAFKALGELRETGLSMADLMSVTEYVYRPDGTQAYGSWTGGFLGVMLKQTEAHNQMHHDWYLDSMLGL